MEELALWKSSQVAEYLGISEWSVDKLARERQIRCVMLGARSRRFRPADVEAFVEERVV